MSQIHLHIDLCPTGDLDTQHVQGCLFRLLTLPEGLSLAGDEEVCCKDR